MRDKLKITITTNYCDNDEDCTGDYCEIDMVIFNETSGELYWENSWGDWYHDKGREKCEAVLYFIQETMSDKFEIEIVKLKTNTYNC